MEIAVLGGGHGCYAAAGDLSEAGHAVRFWRRDAAALAPVIETGTIGLKDAKGTRAVTIAKACTDLKEAVEGAELIVIPLPGHAHEGLFALLAPLLSEGQVVFLPPGSFGSYLLLKAVREAGNEAAIDCAETGDDHGGAGHRQCMFC